MTTIEWSEAALGDLRSIHDYVRARSSQGAVTIASRIEDAERRIALFPRSSRRDAESGTYEYVLRGLPYILIYDLTTRADGQECATIIAVFHTSRDPSAKPGL